MHVLHLYIRRSYFMLLFSSMFLLYGCPYQSNYQLDDTPQIPVNNNYIGIWEGYAVDDVYRYSTKTEVTITQKDSNEYNIMICGEFTKRIPPKKRGKNKYPGIDTIMTTAFLSMAEGKEIMNVRFNEKTYLAEVIYENDALTLLPIAESFTNFIVRSNAQLRERLEFHFHTRLHPSYDESFCLRNMKRK